MSYFKNKKTLKIENSVTGETSNFISVDLNEDAILVNVWEDKIKTIFSGSLKSCKLKEKQPFFVILKNDLALYCDKFNLSLQDPPNSSQVIQKGRYKMVLHKTATGEKPIKILS